VSLLSRARLHTRIIAEREDAVLAEGTVMTQNPVFGQKIKPQQVVFLVVSKKPLGLITPKMFNLTEDAIQKLAKQKAILIKRILIATHFSRGTCFAQIPDPGDPVPASGCIAYISAGLPSRYIMPDLINMPVSEVVSFFDAMDIKVQLFRDHEEEDRIGDPCTVRDQRPAAGVCFDKSKLSSIQLSVE
jgi:beta-lactam-binding protein with PASTA domain